MKISNNNFFSLQSSVKNQSTSSQKCSNNKKASKKNCDEIIISSRNQIKTPDTSDTFIEHLTNSIKEEVHTPSSTEKLDNLKKQIEEGTYKIDIDEIVKKMILR